MPVTAGIDQEPFQRLLTLMTDERCWMKISGAERLTADGRPPYEDVVPFAQALIAAAPDRVLWGTDWPHPNVRHMPDDGDLLDLLAQFAPDPALRRRILVDEPPTPVRLQLTVPCRPAGVPASATAAARAVSIASPSCVSGTGRENRYPCA